jgi:hypothetical protein
MRRRYGVLVYLYLFVTLSLAAESLRVLIAGNVTVSLDNQTGITIPLSYIDSVLIQLDQDARFFRGIELELTAPQSYLPHHGGLAAALYAELNKVPEPGVADIEARQIGFEPIPNKIQNIYQIPLRSGHGLRATPYVSIPTPVISPPSFPILFRLMPVAKGLNDEVEVMQFRLTVKPILGDEGAVKVSPHYPAQLPGKPFTVYIDDEAVERPQEERVLRAGEHQLVILSNDYRSEYRRFMVERGKIIDIVIELRDATPLVFFEAPADSLIFFDGVLLENTHEPYPTQPGHHEVKFQVSDYSIIKSLQVQRGKNYTVALSVDLNISEDD